MYGKKFPKLGEYFQINGCCQTQIHSTRKNPSKALSFLFLNFLVFKNSTCLKSVVLWAAVKRPLALQPTNLQNIFSGCAILTFGTCLFIIPCHLEAKSSTEVIRSHCRLRREEKKRSNRMRSLWLPLTFSPTQLMITAAQLPSLHCIVAPHQVSYKKGFHSRVG